MNAEQFKKLQILQQCFFGRCDGQFNMNSHKNVDQLSSVIKTPVPSSPDKIFPRDSTWSQNRPSRSSSKGMIEKPKSKNFFSPKSSPHLKKINLNNPESRPVKKLLTPALVTIDSSNVTSFLKSSIVLLTSHLQIYNFLSHCLKKDLTNFLSLSRNYFLFIFFYFVFIFILFLFLILFYLVFIYFIIFNYFTFSYFFIYFYFIFELENHTFTLFRQDSIFTSYFSNFFFDSSSQFLSDTLCPVLIDWSNILTDFTPQKIVECFNILLTHLKKNLSKFPM